MKQAVQSIRALALSTLAAAAFVSPALAQGAPATHEPGLAEQLGMEGEAPPDPAMETALAALEAAPVFDGHNDTPLQLRIRLKNQINRFDFNDTLVSARSDPFGRAMHTDLLHLWRTHHCQHGSP